MEIDLRKIDFKKNVHKKYDQSFITRYVIVATIVDQLRKDLNKTKLNILDLGGYNGAARTLLPKDRVTILDIFDDDTLEDYIKVDEVGIPRDDNSFDVVISTDVMEHIPSEGRNKFLDDAIRVAKYATIIAAPFEYDDGRLALEEALVNAIYKGQTGGDYSWLKEHSEYRLPTRRWMEDRLKAEKTTFARFSHSNLRLWGELLGVGYFFANNIAPMEKKLAQSLKSLNTHYFNNVSSHDFPDDGYRTIYVASKYYKKINIHLPEYDHILVDSFALRVRKTLGGSIAQLVRKNFELKEDIKAHIQLEQTLDSEIRHLHYEHNLVISSRTYRILSKIKKVIKKIK